MDLYIIGYFIIGFIVACISAILEGDSDKCVFLVIGWPFFILGDFFSILIKLREGK